MIPAKNYETVFKFVKVMPRKLVASFFPDTVQLPARIDLVETWQIDRKSVKSAFSAESAPLIRFRPWCYINLVTYLLTY